MSTIYETPEYARTKFLEFYAYECIGAAIGNVKSLSRIDFGEPTYRMRFRKLGHYQGGFYEPSL